MLAATVTVCWEAVLFAMAMVRTIAATERTAAKNERHYLHERFPPKWGDICGKL